MMLLLIWKKSEAVDGEIVTRLSAILSNHGLDAFFTDGRHVAGLIKRGFIDSRLHPTSLGLDAFGGFGSTHFTTIINFLESHDEECGWQNSITFETKDGCLVPLEWSI